MKWLGFKSSTIRPNFNKVLRKIISKQLPSSTSLRFSFTPLIVGPRTRGYALGKLTIESERIFRATQIFRSSRLYCIDSLKRKFWSTEYVIQLLTWFMELSILRILIIFLAIIFLIRRRWILGDLK